MPTLNCSSPSSCKHIFISSCSPSLVIIHVAKKHKKGIRNAPASTSCLKYTLFLLTMNSLFFRPGCVDMYAEDGGMKLFNYLKDHYICWECVLLVIRHPWKEAGIWVSSLVEVGKKLSVCLSSRPWILPAINRSQIAEMKNTCLAMVYRRTCDTQCQSSPMNSTALNRQSFLLGRDNCICIPRISDKGSVMNWQSSSWATITHVPRVPPPPSSSSSMEQD